MTSKPDYIFTKVPRLNHVTAIDGDGRQVWEGTLEAADHAIQFLNSGGKRVSVVTDDRGDN